MKSIWNHLYEKICKNNWSFRVSFDCRERLAWPPEARRRQEIPFHFPTVTPRLSRLFDVCDSDRASLSGAHKGRWRKGQRRGRLSFVMCVYRVSKKTWWNRIVFPETNSSWSTCPATLPENEGLFGLFALLVFFVLFVLFVCLVVCLLRAGAGVERELV